LYLNRNYYGSNYCCNYYAGFTNYYFTIAYGGLTITNRSYTIANRGIAFTYRSLTFAISHSALSITNRSITFSHTGRTDLRTTVADGSNGVYH
jgi:hypothetical protein